MRTSLLTLLGASAVTIVIATASPASSNHTGFSAAEYQVGEAVQYVELHVESAPCCPAGSGQFDYHTMNLTALAGEDYRQTSGTVTTAFCGTCTIRVPIVDDGAFEGDERFEVKLTNFRGTFAPERTTAVVTVIDDDPRLSTRHRDAAPSNAPTTDESEPPRKSASTHAATDRAADTSDTPVGEYRPADAPAPATQRRSASDSERDGGGGNAARAAADSESVAGDSQRIIPAVALPILGTLLIAGGAASWMLRRKRA